MKDYKYWNSNGLPFLVTSGGSNCLSNLNFFVHFLRLRTIVKYCNGGKIFLSKKVREVKRRLEYHLGLEDSGIILHCSSRFFYEKLLEYSETTSLYSVWHVFSSKFLGSLNLWPLFFSFVFWPFTIKSVTVIPYTKADK